ACSVSPVSPSRWGSVAGPAGKGSPSRSGSTASANFGPARARSLRRRYLSTPGSRRRGSASIRSMADTHCAASRSTVRERSPSRQCSISSTKKNCRSISTSNRGRSSSSTTGRWATAAPLSSTTPSPPASAISSVCGCANAAAAPIRADTEMPAPTNIDIGAALAEAEELYRAHNPKSLAQHREACAAMPGGNTRSAIYVDPFPLTIARGEGARLWDIDGHEYVDFLSGFTPGIYGHSHPAICRAIEGALEGGLNFGAHNAAEARFAAAICARFPSIELVRFTNSGTEANLMAVSAARAITGRGKILVFKGGYHGGVFYVRRHGSALNAPFDFLLGHYNALAAVEALVQPHRGELAAILIEPMQGTTGCIAAEYPFLAGLRALADEAGALLIYDE